MGKADKRKKGMSDAQLAEELLRQKVMTPGQLKAALDYQASVGGGLVAVLRKLGLVREEILQAFLDSLSRGERFEGAGTPTRTPPAFEPSKLRIHKKLLEKVPSEFTDHYGLLFFFPPPGTRAILMSSDSAVPEAGIAKLQQLLGVEICPIDLSEKDRAAFRAGRSAGGAGIPAGGPPRGAPPGTPERPEGWEGTSRPDRASVDLDDVDEKTLVRAAVELLVKKGVLSTEELEVEIGILRYARSK